MGKQLLGALIAFLAIAMLLAALLLRRPTGSPSSLPYSPPSTLHSPPPLPSALHPPTPRARTALLLLLEKAGRAWVLKDRKTLDALRIPEFDDEDKAWLIQQLKGPMFVAVGACMLLAHAHVDAAVGPLGELLTSDASIFVKDAAIDALGLLKGDVSVTVLLGVLKGRFDASLRARAAKALANFDGPEVYRALADVVLNDPVASVRGAAATALALLDSQRAVKLFLERIQWENNLEIVTQLVVLAWQYGGEAKLEELRDAVASNPVAKGAVLEAIKRDSDARYKFAFAASFFNAGGAPVPFDPSRHRRVGVTVELGKGMVLADVLRPLFDAAPLDRYRGFFYVRIAAELATDVAGGAPAPRAYDVTSAPLAQGVPVNDLDGTVFLSFVEPTAFAPGILGLTEGTKALVTPVSLLHEFGHAFAKLADEYDSTIASPWPAVNLAPRKPPETYAWKPLAERGFVPIPPRDRVELKEGVDIGAWRTPSDDCHMNSHPTDSRYCPVCQLAIIARIAELSGVLVPW